jgi:hypothetical protein
LRLDDLSISFLAAKKSGDLFGLRQAAWEIDENSVKNGLSRGAHGNYGLFTHATRFFTLCACLLASHQCRSLPLIYSNNRFCPFS